MNLTYFLIAAIFVAIITVFFMKKQKNINSKVLTSLIGMTIAMIILVFPLFQENFILSRIVFSIIYAIHVIFLSQDVQLISSIDTSQVINVIYIVVIYILFFLQPLTTATALLTLLGNNLSKIKLFFSRNKEMIIFSEINSKTLTIAKNQYIKDENIILFLGSKDEKYKNQIKSVKGIILDQKVTDLKIKNKNITYYLFSNNEEENLSDALELLNSNTKKKKLKIYVLNNTQEARIILDSAPKNGIHLELINEVERMVYNHIYNEPIYRNCKNNQISILIVGCGKLGNEFLKAVTWCGQIINHKLNINVIDIDANRIKEKLNVTCPELLNNYNYNFIEADIYSNKAINELDKLKEQNINYVLVALDTEQKNIEVATLLRTYFLRQDTDSYNNKPSINLWIENDAKKVQIDNLKHGNLINSYNLNVFGNIEEMYGSNSIVNSEVENLAKQVHSIYDKDDMKNNLSRFYELEYNKKSSRAVAIHLKYKLYSILKYTYNDDLENDLDNNLEKVFKQYNKLFNTEILQKLVENEHDRWNAYTRTDGFKMVEPSEVEKYKMVTKNNKHFLAKLHPALVPFDELERVSKILNTDFISSDIEIINNIEKILSKEIYR